MKSLIIVIFTFILGLGAYNVQNSFASTTEKEAVCHVADKDCACSCTDCAEGKATCETCANCAVKTQKASANAAESCCEAKDVKAACAGDCEKACASEGKDCADCASCCG